MFWMIVAAVVSTTGQPGRLMADPVVAFSSEEKCVDAVRVLQPKVKAPLECVSFDVIGGVPLESY